MAEQKKQIKNIFKDPVFPQRIKSGEATFKELQSEGTKILKDSGVTSQSDIEDNAVDTGLFAGIKGITAKLFGQAKKNPEKVGIGLKNSLQLLIKDVPPTKIVMGANDLVENIKEKIGLNETGGLRGKRYSFRKFSGREDLGDDLGKYQVTEENLRLYSKRYLDRGVTPEEFISNPK